MNIAELRPYLDKMVVLRLYDGEIATVKVIWVDDEYVDIIADFVRTDRPEKYKGPADSVYTIQAADIASVDEV